MAEYDASKYMHLSELIDSGMANYDEASKTLTSFVPDCQLQGILIVDVPVKEIADRAFANQDELNSVIFSTGEVANSLEKIGSHAFDGCAALEDISIPKSVHTIGDGAFAGTNNLYVYAEGSAGSLPENNWKDGARDMNEPYYNSTMSIAEQTVNMENFLNTLKAELENKPVAEKTNVEQTLEEKENVRSIELSKENIEAVKENKEKEIASNFDLEI